MTRAFTKQRLEPPQVIGAEELAAKQSAVDAEAAGRIVPYRF